MSDYTPSLWAGLKMIVWRIFHRKMKRRVPAGKKARWNALREGKKDAGNQTRRI